MNMAIVFLSVILVALIAISTDLSTKNTNLIITNTRLRIENQRLQMSFLIKDTMSSLEKVPNKNDIKLQTKQLIVLAIKNNNDNEAKNAALTACKQLHKELKL